ncbi:MAG TPA: hypothetical protein VNI52_04955 [Sphingobacteriaceae bacterium]|nr:hypothetical protein [Sphingobacteriaceae bacterium]
MKNQLDRKFNLKDSDIIEELEPRLKNYRKAIGRMVDLDDIDAANVRRSALVFYIKTLLGVASV